MVVTNSGDASNAFGANSVSANVAFDGKFCARNTHFASPPARRLATNGNLSFSPALTSKTPSVLHWIVIGASSCSLTFSINWGVNLDRGRPRSAVAP